MHLTANFIVVVSLMLTLIFVLHNIEKASSYGIISTLKANLGEVQSVFNHANGVYYVGRDIHQVRLIHSTTNEDMAVVGTGACCYGGDGGPALSATMHWAHDVYVTASGDIYFTEHLSRRIRYVNATGVISTVAGTGNIGYSATPTLAINADLFFPRGLVLDSNENIYFADDCVIRKVTRSTGIITTIAGSSATDCSFSGDSGLAVNAKFNYVFYFDLDSDENIIFGDHNSYVIRRISRQTGIINTIVSGIGGCQPAGLSVDRSTNDVYFLDYCQRVLRSSKMYNSDSYAPFVLVAGGNGYGYSGDGGDANSAQINTDSANIEFDSSSLNGAFLIADRHNRAIRVVTNPCEEGSELFGNDCWCSNGYYSDNGRAPCNQCDYGSSSYKIGGKLTDCKCQNGFYSSTGLSPCDACPDGTESKTQIAATSCNCKPGYTGQGDEVPSDILVGTGNFYEHSYRDLNNFYTSHTFSPPCLACPANSGTWDVYKSPTDLQEGQGSKCLCDPDTKSVTGFGPCEPCAEGSGSVRLTIYNSYGLHYDLFDMKSIQMTRCFCKAGYYSPDGSGTDSGENCLSCPIGKISTNKDLIYTVNYRSPFAPLNTKCVCLRNYYKNASVIIAPTGHVESSDDCILCPEGSATTGYDGTACTICDIGYYSPDGLAPCAKCADGKTTNGYQQTSCTVTSTFAPTLSPTPSPTPSSPSITNPPIAHPTRAPVQSKRPTAYPTTRPTQPNQCPEGYFSFTGFTPDCQACPIGTSTSEPGMTMCDICADGYYGRFGEPPCTACPESSMSNEKRTACTQCIGYEQGCTLGSSIFGGSGAGGGGGGCALLSNVTSRLSLLEKNMKAQLSYIERYKRQRNQAEL